MESFLGPQKGVAQTGASNGTSAESMPAPRKGGKDDYAYPGMWTMADTTGQKAGTAGKSAATDVSQPRLFDKETPVAEDKKATTGQGDTSTPQQPAARGMQELLMQMMMLDMMVQVVKQKNQKSATQGGTKNTSGNTGHTVSTEQAETTDPQNGQAGGPVTQAGQTGGKSRDNGNQSRNAQGSQNQNNADNPMSADIDTLTTDPALRNSLAEGARTRDGEILIAKAAKQDVKISQGDPAAAESGADDKDGAPVVKDEEDAGTVVNGVTLTNTKGTNTRVIVRDGTNVKTLFHELVHADTPEDGDSKQEEGIADVVGSQIANATDSKGGLSGNDEQIYQNKQKFYQNLGQSNNVRSDLENLGIGVDV